MGRWTILLAERAAEVRPAPPSHATAKTDETGDLSVLAARPEGCAPQSHAGDDERKAARLARLLRWGWPANEAEALTERLARRDREGDDDRVSCVDCGHYRPGRCGNYRRAAMQSPDAGRDLAGLLQRCPGFEPAR
mgnify:CR=1 FL=1